MYKTITTAEFLANNQTTYSNDEPIFCDIESDGLYINCSLIQVRQSGMYHMVTTNSDDEVELMKYWMHDKHLVWWNGSYDLGTLNFPVTPKTDDLWVAFKIAYPHLKEFTLDKVVAYLKYDHLYKGLDKKALQKAGFVRNAYLSQDQLRYAAADVEALELMWKDDRMSKVMAGSSAYKLAVIAIEEAMVWQQNGLPVLRDKVKDYLVTARAQEKEYMATLEKMNNGPLNPRSPKQVREALGSPTTDKSTLTRIVLEGELPAVKKATSWGKISGGRTKDERRAYKFTQEKRDMAEMIMKARKAKNDVSKLTQYSYPKVYGRFSPVGARTSRWSCKGTKDIGCYTNLQNLSRDFKKCFGVPEDDGRIIVAADFATLEIRIACAIMNEPNMHKALMAGEDIHKNTASLIYNKPLSEVHGKERSNAKVANFGLTYGMGRETFKHYAYDMYGIKFTDAEAKELIGKFFTGYPGLKRYHNSVADAMLSHKFLGKTALGYPIKPSGYADSINAGTQGTGGEVMRLSIHLLIKKDPEAINIIVNSIHDAAYLLVPVEKQNYWGTLLKESMQEAWYEIRKSKFFHFHDIPMPIDLMTGYNMGELEEDFAGGGQALSMEEMREAQERNKKMKRGVGNVD